MKRKERQETSFFREVILKMVYILLALTLIFVVINFVGYRMEIRGSSMSPALDDGDQIIVDKISYQFVNPNRFDIIVFPFQYQSDTYYAKRIIGLPGETVQITDGVIYINGTALQEDYGTESMESSGLAYEPIILGEDEYFVLGDNRNESSDSREPSIGNVKKDIILGKAWIRIWPFHVF